jgi:aminoglycoside phosphotransferase (APT) family kinase protein
MTTLESRIQEYLQARLAGARELTVTNLQRIPGGASRETWSFDASWTADGSHVREGFIIRRDPDASLLDTDRGVEFRVIQAVHGSVPVPKAHWIEEDASALDRPFFVMSRIDGCETNPTRVLMDPRFFAARERIGREFVDILARLHQVEWQSLGLDFLDGPDSVEKCGLTEIEKWESIIDRDSLEPQPVFRGAFRWLRHHRPAPPRRIVLVHADYRTGNFLAAPDGEIKGILDWEMTHLGDPMEDIGWVCMRPWRWLGNELIGGLMEREQFYRMYEEAGGERIDEEAVRFWEILGNVKLAAIFITGARNFREGRTRSPMMAFLGRNIRRLELEVMDLMGVGT